MSNNWLTPYSIKRRLTMRRWPWWSFYSVIFDDTEIMVSCERDEAEKIAACCNGAYNLGRLQGLSEANVFLRENS